MMNPDCERRVFDSYSVFVQVTLTDVRRSSPVPVIHVSVKEGTRPYPWATAQHPDHSNAAA